MRALLFVFLIVGLIVSQRAGIPRVSTWFYTRGQNRRHQAGLSDHLAPIDDELMWQTNSFNGPFVFKSFKHACGLSENVIVVMHDDTVGIAGASEFIEGVTDDAGDFVYVGFATNSELNTGETIVDLRCGATFAIFQTSEGRLLGLGLNNNNVLTTGATNEYVTELTHLMTADLVGKTVKTFGVSANRATQSALMAVDTDGQIYYRGHIAGGTCRPAAESSPINWKMCDGGYFNTTAYGDLNVTTIAGGKNHFHLIARGGNEIYYSGLGDYSGIGLPSTYTCDSPVLIAYDTSVGGEISELNQKTIVDIVCAKDTGDSCMALDSDGVIYTWNNGVIDDYLLARTAASTNAATVAKEVGKLVDLCKSTLLKVQHISGMYDALCFVCTDNKVYCWGDNEYFSIVHEKDLTYNEPKRTAILAWDLVAYYKWTADSFGRTLYFFKGASAVICVNILLLIAAIFALV